MKYLQLLLLMLFVSVVYGQEIDLAGEAEGLYPELQWEIIYEGDPTPFTFDCNNLGVSFWVDYERELPVIQNIRITNVGDAPLVIYEIYLTLGNEDYYLQDEECSEGLVNDCFLLSGHKKSFSLYYAPEEISHGSAEVVRVNSSIGICEFPFSSYCPPCKEGRGKSGEKSTSFNQVPLKVYPSITTDLLYIQQPSTDHPKQLYIYAASGNLVQTISLSSNSKVQAIDVSHFVGGTYFIRTSDGHSIRFFKAD